MCSDSWHNTPIAIITQGTKSNVKPHQLHSRPTICKTTRGTGQFKRVIVYFFAWDEKTHNFSATSVV